MALADQRENRTRTWHAGELLHPNIITGGAGPHRAPYGGVQAGYVSTGVCGRLLLHHGGGTLLGAAGQHLPPPERLQ